MIKRIYYILLGIGTELVYVGSILIAFLGISFVFYALLK